MLFAGVTKVLDDLEAFLNEKFKIKSSKKITTFIGVKFSIKKKVVYLTQEDHILDAVEMLQNVQHH